MTGFLRREGLAALSGLLLALSFPKFGHWSVAWVALVPLLIALAEAPAGHAWRLGYVAGAVSSMGLLYWTALVVIQFGGLSFPVGVGVMVLLCLAVALFPALFAWTVGRWLRTFGVEGLLLAPLAWVATEVLRGYTFFRFAWCLLGYSQQPNLPFIQLASWTAVYGVSFLVALSSSVLAYAALETRPERRRRALLGLLAVLLTAWGHGILMLRRSVPTNGTLRTGLVQASILQDDKWDASKAFENIARHEELTRRAADAGARLVVWPESAVPYYFDRTPPIAGPLRALARERGLYLLFGNDDREDTGTPDGPRVWVGAKMLTPEGELALRYHKIRLVPFGEYVPMQPLLTMGGRYAAKLVQQVADFTPGTEAVLGEADGHPLGAFICYEAIFPDLVRRFAAQGAELLVNITNDGWYGRTSAPRQHLAMAAFRAVENGTYLVRAANTGVTAVVDPRGRIVEHTELFERTVVVRDVPLVRANTFYARHGDVFAWGCLGAAVALTAVGLRPRG